MKVFVFLSHAIKVLPAQITISDAVETDTHASAHCWCLISNVKVSQKHNLNSLLKDLSALMLSISDMYVVTLF